MRTMEINGDIDVNKSMVIDFNGYQWYHCLPLIHLHAVDVKMKGYVLSLILKM